ncbi:MAG: flagellar hook capping FlgD N-terminal domain-containing protein [Alphaproteobacteria bacterium]|nr:flagellar hook capping FlgD N-terminal domain-containing protein [Alphaproteobacteria bacterium]
MSTTSSVTSATSSTILDNYIAQQQAATAASTASSSSSASSKLTGDYATFLKILTTQLQNQDPMSATDTNQFTQELVQFAGVEQQISTNDKLEQLVSLMKGNGITSLLNYVGQTIEAPANDQILVQGGSAALSYNLPSTAKSVTITVKDSTGATIATMAGPTASGVNKVAWDGVKTDGTQAADGVYKLSIAATDSESKAMTISNIDMIGRVTGLQTDSDGTATLSLGAASVKAADVTAVYAGVTTAASDTTS